MIKFQIGKLTLKNFLLHWGVALILTIIHFFDILKESSIKEIIITVGVASFIPGMIVSILLIEFVKKIIQDIKEGDYLVVIATIIFGIFYAKHFYKL